jgi:hypothetical protein
MKSCNSLHLTCMHPVVSKSPAPPPFSRLRSVRPQMIRKEVRLKAESYDQFELAPISAYDTFQRALGRRQQSGGVACAHTQFNDDWVSKDSQVHSDFLILQSRLPDRVDGRNAVGVVFSSRVFPYLPFGNTFAGSGLVSTFGCPSALIFSRRNVDAVCSADRGRVHAAQVVAISGIQRLWRVGVGVRLFFLVVGRRLGRAPAALCRRGRARTNTGIGTHAELSFDVLCGMIYSCLDWRASHVCIFLFVRTSLVAGHRDARARKHCARVHRFVFHFFLFVLILLLVVLVIGIIFFDDWRRRIGAQRVCVARRRRLAAGARRAAGTRSLGCEFLFFAIASEFYRPQWKLTGHRFNFLLSFLKFHSLTHFNFLVCVSCASRRTSARFAQKVVAAAVRLAWPPLSARRRVTAVLFSPAHPTILLTAHAPPGDSSSGGGGGSGGGSVGKGGNDADAFGSKGVLLLWHINQPARPQKYARQPIQGIYTCV